jgi:hypothetical protein
MMQDGLFPIIHLQHNKKQPHHTRAILAVVSLLWRSGYHAINYDHINATIPKCNISLHHMGKRYDVAYIDSKGRRVLVQI